MRKRACPEPSPTHPSIPRAAATLSRPPGGAHPRYPRDRCLGPPPPQSQSPARTERREKHNWTPLGPPGDAGRGGGPHAGATPGKHQQWQLWSGWEQWLPREMRGWASFGLHRARPSSPARSLAWASAGRRRLAQAPGPGVRGRRRAGAGCHPHRRQSTASRRRHATGRRSRQRRRGCWPVAAPDRHKLPHPPPCPGLGPAAHRLPSVWQCQDHSWPNTGQGM